MSDSLNSLRDIYFSFSNKFQEILNDLLLYINKSDISFTFCYIPAHVSYYPHDIADSLARRAANLPTINLYINLEFHEVYSIIDIHFCKERTENFSIRNSVLK